MSVGVFVIVLLAALLHAGWNALVKGGSDKTAAMAAVVLGQGVAGIIALPFVTLPDPACWPWLLGGLALHFFYQVFLIGAYRTGDLTQVYPIARGVAPLIVAVVSATALGVSFSGTEKTGILMIGLGIASISFVRRGDGIFQPKAALLALATGTFIAGYSLTDGIGARIAGTGPGFYSVLAIAEAIVFGSIVGAVSPSSIRGSLKLWRVMLIGGGASYAAYALVVHAFTLAPLALVTALRETSIIFALLIGVVFLNERLSLAKVASTMATVAGAALLRFSKG